MGKNATLNKDLLPDYHLHTRRCNHAEGPLRNYVEAAIEYGLTEICFTDHNPFDGTFDSEHRMRSDEIEQYLQDIEDVANEYTEIRILRGLEIDYIESREEEISKLIQRFDFDFLLLSVHFIPHWPENAWVFNYSTLNKPLDVIYSDYLTVLQKGVKSGLFQGIAHLDIIKKRGTDLLAMGGDQIKSVLKSVKDAGMSIELNSSGIRKAAGENFPGTPLLKEIVNQQIPITLGSDAHLPEQVGYEIRNNKDRLAELGGKLALYRSGDRYTIQL